MNFLFYTLTVINILFFLFALWGKGFRQSFGASTDFSSIMISLLFIIILGSLIVKFGVRHKLWAVAVAALPVVILFIMYLFDKRTGSGM